MGPGKGILQLRLPAQAPQAALKRDKGEMCPSWPRKSWVQMRRISGAEGCEICSVWVGGGDGGSESHPAQDQVQPGSAWVKAQNGDLSCCCSALGGVAALEMGLTSLTSPELNQFFSTAICFLGISLIFKLTFLPGITCKVQIILIKYLLAGAPSILPR